MLNVLIACEESQRVCIEMRKIGHRAFSCDILPCSGGHPEWHIQGDVLPLLNGNCTFQTADTHTHTQRGRWDLIVAFPPCTYLTKAGACRLYRVAGAIDPDRMKLAVEARLFFQRFFNADCQHVAIENPTPLHVVCLPKPSQVIQPYHFGHPYSKRTCLWLKGLPTLIPTEIMSDFSPWMPSNTGGLSRGMGGARGTAHDPKTASRTFSGIARAMAEQWTAYIENGEQEEEQISLFKETT